VKIIIPGDPIPKASVRLGKRGAYDSQKFERSQVSWKMKLALREQNGKMVESQGIFVSFLFKFLPIGTSILEKNMCLWGLKEHDVKPDFDNLCKFYCDSGNGILWKDDAKISKGQWHKKFSNFPCTIITYNAIKKITMNTELEKVIKVFTPEQVLELIDDFTPIMQSCEDDFLENREEFFLPVLASRLVIFANKWSKKLGKIQDA
jgi:Holliday junction resolvase RusA-like endonuclease